MTAKLTPWQSVRVWWLNIARPGWVAGPHGAECTKAETIAALREYRNTGGIYLCVLADPRDFDADGAPLSGKGPHLEDAGPAVNAIDWTGFSAAAAAADAEEEAEP